MRAIAKVFCISSIFDWGKQDPKGGLYDSNKGIGIAIVGITTGIAPGTGIALPFIPILGASRPPVDISILKVSSGIPLAGRVSPKTT